MLPKPPRPEPPRRAMATQALQQQERRRVPDVLVIDIPASSPVPAPRPATPPSR